jgi:predicted  nucleic acid-binding Zn-ribbon protein
MGLAALRRQLAALQMHLAEAQGQLAQEQHGRAEDADALAVMLERVASSERAVAEAANLRLELEREREFVEELRVSVREKYEDCNSLRQRLADAESLIAKQIEEAAERYALSERAELLQRQLTDAQKQLELERASEAAGRTERAALSTQLEDVRREQASLEAELQKANSAVKNANMRAFAANKQLDSWKSESQRMIEQSRLEHQISLDALRREIMQGNATVAELRRQLDDAAEKLDALTLSFDAIDKRECEIDTLRELAQAARRAALDQTGHARKALAPITNAPRASSPPVAATAAGPTSAGFAAAKRPPAIPPRPPPLTKSVAPMAQQAPIPAAEKSSEAPSLEIGETDMRVEDLVEELLEAQNRNR